MTIPTTRLVNTAGMPPTTAQPTGNQARRGSAGRRVARRRPTAAHSTYAARCRSPSLRAAHPRQALLTTAVLAGAAAMAGRSLEEVGLVAATVLVGQVVLGWHNDVVDAQRDRDHARPDKPIALDHVDRGTVTFAIAVAVLAVVPLSIANGIEAGPHAPRHPRGRDAHQRRHAAAQPVLLPSLDGDVRPVPGVPVVRRLGRRRRAAGRPRSR